MCVPILLALVNMCNIAFLEPVAGRMITPFAESFKGYPNFVAALESHTLGAARRMVSVVVGSCSTGICSDSGEYVHLLYQGGGSLIMAMGTQCSQSSSRANEEENRVNHDALTCSLFAHADMLAFGNNHGRNRNNTTNTDGCGRPGCCTCLGILCGTSP